MKRKKRKEDTLKGVFFTHFFVTKYDVAYNYGVFFAIGRRNAKAVLRNKIKRYFRAKVKEKAKTYNLEKYSICLIAKKKVKFKDIPLEDIKKEIDFIVEKVLLRISRNVIDVKSNK